MRKQHSITSARVTTPPQLKGREPDPHFSMREVAEVSPSCCKRARRTGDTIVDIYEKRLSIPKFMMRIEIYARPPNKKIHSFHLE